VTGPQSFATFEAILSNATTLNTGFIVLEHDLYAQTVDLAIGYTLPAAMTFTPALTVSFYLHPPVESTSQRHELAARLYRPLQSHPFYEPVPRKQPKHVIPLC
jgi:hypothetical protein